MNYRRLALLFIPILTALFTLGMLHVAARAQAAFASQQSQLPLLSHTKKVLPPTHPANYQLMSTEDWLDFQRFLVTMPATLTMPSTIRVAMTGDWHCEPTATYTVEVVNFNSYVRHVLPNEWPHYWRKEALRAGAMAAKMFAWYWIDRGGWRPDEFDVWDSTCSQWYAPDNPTRNSTDQAIYYTWNWRMVNGSGLLFQPYYKQNDYEYECTPGICMSQEGSNEMANDGYTWDEILLHYYSIRNPQLIYPYTYPAGWSLQFNGLPGDVDENRLLIPVDDPETNQPGPPVDVGAEDFTIEWWMRARSSDYPTTSITITCGASQDWITGSIVLDRWMPEQGGGYGVSLESGRVLFGVTGQTISDSLTLCGNADVVDGQWHHVAVERRASDGQVWLFVDGQLDAAADGPDGDISYPDTLTPTYPSTPYLAVGTWRHDDTGPSGTPPADPFYRGWLDELRFSDLLRYTQPFSLPQTVFITDANTLALYHFDEALGNTIHDTSGAAGGPSDGLRLYGGTVDGPEWQPSGLFRPVYEYSTILPLVMRLFP